MRRWILLDVKFKFCTRELRVFVSMRKFTVAALLVRHAAWPQLPTVPNRQGETSPQEVGCFVLSVRDWKANLDSRLILLFLSPSSLMFIL